jgi:hypothetical protein
MVNPYESPESTGEQATEAYVLSPAELPWAVRAPLQFGGAMVLAMYALKILAVPMILVIGGGDTTGPILEVGLGLVCVSFLLLPLETFVGQTLPIWVLRKLGLRNWWGLCILSAVVFGVLHLGAGPGGFFVGLTTGVVLSYCWLSWRQLSIAAAFWYTTAVHVAHNAIAFPLYLLGEVLG